MRDGGHRGGSQIWYGGRGGPSSTVLGAGGDLAAPSSAVSAVGSRSPPLRGAEVVAGPGSHHTEGSHRRRGLTRWSVGWRRRPDLLVEATGAGEESGRLGSRRCRGCSAERERERGGARERGRSMRGSWDAERRERSQDCSTGGVGAQNVDGDGATAGGATVPSRSAFCRCRASCGDRWSQ